MFTRIFGRPKREPNVLESLDTMNQSLEALEKREKLMQKKIAAEVERAKHFIKAKNKAAALQCMTRKRQFEQQVEHLGNHQLRIHDQMIMLEGARAITETVSALRTGASAMKNVQKAMTNWKQN